MRRLSVAILGISLLLASCGVDDPSAATSTSSSPASGQTTPATSADTSTTTVSPLAHGMFDGQLAEAWNDGDVAAYFSFFAPDGTFDWSPVSAVATSPFVAYLQAIGWRATSSTCSTTGGGSSGSSAAYAHCLTAYTSDLHEAAGFRWLLREDYVLDDDGRILAYTHFGDAPYGVDQYERDLSAWILRTHPDLSDLSLAMPESGLIPTEALRRVIALVPEFVDASPIYPTGSVVVPPPTPTGEVDGVETFNADEVQRDLVSWALAAFDREGLERPQVLSVSFPPTEACADDLMGMASHSASGSRIDVCQWPSDLEVESSPPLTARRAILHELSHVWIAHSLGDQKRLGFLQFMGLDSWTGSDAWEEAGSEQAAETIMWGLMDVVVQPRVPGATCETMASGFALLTGREATLRLADCTTLAVDYSASDTASP